MMQRFKEKEVCITQTSCFDGNCLNVDVLETSLYDYFKVDGPHGDEETHSKWVLNDDYMSLYIVYWVEQNGPNT